LLAEDKPQPFGPKCAENYAAGILRGIPDHTKGVDFPEDQLREEDGIPDSSVKMTARRNSRDVSQRTTKTQREENINNAVIYASLRCERLPSQGFRASGLIWQPLADFFESYKRGQVTNRRLNTVLGTIRSTAAKLNVQFLSLDNLRACYSYGWIIAKIFAECAPTRKMSASDYRRLHTLRDALRRDMFLDDRSCGEILGFTKSYLAHPPSAISLRFVAARPKFTPAPEDRLKL